MRVKKKIGILMLTDYNYDVDEESEQRFIEQYGANITIQLRDGRYFLYSSRPWLSFCFCFRMDSDKDWIPLKVQVWPVREERSLYCVRITTSHYSFCLKNSCAIRDISEFYQLRSILTVSGSKFFIDSDTIIVHISMIKALFADSEYLHDDTLPATAANALGILLQNNIKWNCNFPL